MLDNFSPRQIKEAVRLLRKEGFFGKVLLEASGGITAENIIEYSSTGVDIVSLGEITDSPKALDISLEITKVYGKSR
jgi:nicotinate-nucleotide pyrophosphorylase (carboxylating)